MIKKILAATALILLAASLCSCKPEKTPDFRSADFGMSKSQVEKTEEKPYDFASDDLMFFNGTLGAEKVEVYYHFVEDALVDAECRIIIDERIFTEIIESYENMRSYLSEIYGEPLSDDYRVWITDSTDLENEKEQLLLYNQHIEYLTEWKTETVSARLTLNYKDKQINYVFYASAPDYQAQLG